jgi:hypothetical protein
MHLEYDCTWNLELCGPGAVRGVPRRLRNVNLRDEIQREIGKMAAAISVPTGRFRPCIPCGAAKKFVVDYASCCRRMNPNASPRY